VTPDVDVQRRAVFSVFAMLKTKDPATTKMNEFLNGTRETSPFIRAEKITVNADISSVLPISQSSWQVDWQETTRDRDGGLVGKPVHMRAVLEIYILSPSTNARESDIQRNPLGIFVHDYNWQEV
jgi:type IV secretion system protein VirB5